MNKTIDIKNLKVAKRYATALAESTIDCIDKTIDDMNLLNVSIFQNEEVKTFFLHPVVSLKDKKEAIEEGFKDKISDTTLNFVQTLLDENRFIIFKTILELFIKETEKIKNLQRVEVISAVDMENEERERLSKKLSEKLNKNVILNYSLDSSILGGLVIKIEDKIIDLSLKAGFENFKKDNKKKG